MRKLLRGMADFRRTRPPGHAEALSRLATGQAPDALLVCCADSRVAPNVFASVEPGDLLVVRNVGNLVPRHTDVASDRAGASVPAAIELAIGSLRVRDVVVCGHSSCAAMRLLHTGERPAGAPHLAAWLRHGEPAREGLGPAPAGMDPADHLSQRSAVLQLAHLRTYPVVRAAEAEGALRLHAWWFDIGRAEVLAHDAGTDRFVPLDEARIEALVARID
jgi:carbonic anhydrase